MIALNSEILDFLRANKLNTLLNDMSLTTWIYRQVDEVGIQYIQDMRSELIKTIFIVDDLKIKTKYKHELMYLDFLIKNYK